MKNILIPNYDESWAPFFKENMDLLEKIDSQIDGDDYNPNPENVLRFAKKPLNECKVLILGQDTYPAKGVATGRAFEVGGLSDWNVWFKQVSLKNIVRNLYGTYTGESKYTSFKDIQGKIVDGSFRILPPNELMASWSNQGVLLLNAALTCKVGEPGSHSDYWRDFTNNLLQYIDEQNQSMIYFLWGAEAKKFEPLIKNGKIYKSRHPMMCDEKNFGDFLKNEHFEKTKGLINWLGL